MKPFSDKRANQNAAGAALWVFVFALSFGAANACVQEAPAKHTHSHTANTVSEPDHAPVGYNAIVFPLTAGVSYPFVLRPEVAALSMSGSTFAVALNAPLLKRTNRDGIRGPGDSPAPGPAHGAITPAPAKTPPRPAQAQQQAPT